MPRALRRMSFIVAACVLIPLPSAAEFEMEVDGTLLLGNLVPSFYGGVAFEQCSGERWLIAGADLLWSERTCDPASGTLATVTGGAGWGNPVVIPLPPKPIPCGLCDEGDLVDLFVPEPKPRGCPMCVPGVEALYTYSLGLPALGAYAQSLDSKAQLVWGPFDNSIETRFPAYDAPNWWAPDWWQDWLAQPGAGAQGLERFGGVQFRGLNWFGSTPGAP